MLTDDELVIVRHFLRKYLRLYKTFAFIHTKLTSSGI